MEDPKPPMDPLLSQAETRSGGTSPASAPSPPRSAPAFPVPDWDRYECLGFLGQGGMGMVFLARDRRLGREVAIKFVRLDGDRHGGRFLAEARAQARVDHEHVCKVFEVGEVAGRVFITMQHIAGTSLDVTASGLSLEQKVLVLRDAARGVHEAHRMGIIHRDLKPSNIMVERGEDGALRTFVMDFGLAHEWNQDVTETGSVLGTPAYMSPEQARGEVNALDRRTDLYSLGATLHQLLTGRPPVGGANALEILSAVSSVEPVPLRGLGRDIPRDLEAITLKCLEKERSRRYDSARALADDLDRYLAGEPVQARPTGLWYRLQRRLWKHKQLTALGAVALMLVLLALGAALRTRRDAGRRERLAQQFTEAMGQIESLARYSALSSLHDIRPDLQAVRSRMDQLQADMRQAGDLAKGPGHYALGRGYWTLDDGEKALEHLRMAWDAGFREPRVAFALAVALGRQYQERLLEAERMTSADQREARKRDIEATLRTPALGFLRQARGSDTPSPVYLEALLAFYQGRLDEALDRLKVLEDDLPWFYEGPLLRGSLLQARAWKDWNRGEREAAHEDFEAGRATLALAAASARSAPSVHAALAELELNALVMEKYGQGQVEQAFERGMAAVKKALAAQADHVPSLLLQSALLENLADYRASHGEPAETLVQQAVGAAQKALEAGPTRADAWIALGLAYYQWGNVRLERDLDPTEQLARGLQALEALSAEKRDYRVENHIGLIHQIWSDFEEEHGRDPTAQLGGAITAYGRATRMEPHLLPAWINLGTCLQQRAALPRAEEPVGDLQAALKVLDQAQALNPKHFVPYFVRGKVLYALALQKRSRGGDPGPDLLAAIEANRQGLAINPAMPHLQNGIGIAQVMLARVAWEGGGDPHPQLILAQQAFRKAIALAPRQVYGHLNLSDLLIQKARWEGDQKALPALREATMLLQRSQALFPGNKGLLANLGRLQAVRIETAGPGAALPEASLVIGEAALTQALALDPHDGAALLYLGELRAAAARWKAFHRLAGPGDFDRAMEPLRQALAGAPRDQEAAWTLANLHRARAEWERTMEQDPGPTLAQGRVLVNRLLEARPAWGEALVLRAALELEAAERLPPGARALQAKEAAQAFDAAFAVNRNQTREWAALAERAHRLEKGPS